MNEFWAYLNGNVSSWHDPIVIFYLFILAIYLPRLYFQIRQEVIKPLVARFRRATLLPRA